MNKEQIKYLNDSGYEVIENVNLIKDNHFVNPNFYLMYDPKSKSFSICIVAATVSVPQSTNYLLELISKIEIADKLNQLT